MPLYGKTRRVRSGLMAVVGVCLCAPMAAEAAQPAGDKPPPTRIEAAGGVVVRKPVKTLLEFKREHAVLQRYDFSCGAAALATVMQHYFKLRVTEESIVSYIIHLRGPEQAVLRYKQKKGFSLLDLKVAAMSADFRCFAYSGMNLADLVELNAPAIVPVRTREYDHFVVFRGLRGDRVYLADPVAGNVTMKASNFVAVWHGGIGMVFKSKKGLKPTGWQPDESTQGFYVSQNMLRAMTSPFGLGFQPKIAGEF